MFEDVEIYSSREWAEDILFHASRRRNMEARNSTRNPNLFGGSLRRETIEGVRQIVETTEENSSAAASISQVTPSSLVFTAEEIIVMVNQLNQEFQKKFLNLQVMFHPAQSVLQLLSLSKPSETGTSETAETVRVNRPAQSFHDFKKKNHDFIRRQVTAQVIDDFAVYSSEQFIIMVNSLNNQIQEQCLHLQILFHPAQSQLQLLHLPDPELEKYIEIMQNGLYLEPIKPEFGRFKISKSDNGLSADDIRRRYLGRKTPASLDKFLEDFFKNSWNLIKEKFIIPKEFANL